MGLTLTLRHRLTLAELEPLLDSTAKGEKQELKSKALLKFRVQKYMSERKSRTPRGASLMG